MQGSVTWPLALLCHALILRCGKFAGNSRQHRHKTIFFRISLVPLLQKRKKKSLWSECDRRLWAKLVPTFADNFFFYKFK
jgi:hypothetical protein